ncbi:MAG: tRNA pseudouridine(38-40) synthase TruA [Campylobacterota bacterium]|nr:tRNA pseudouridine(38-40) synthase TruA [Campylobacterota bacterium]
MKKIIFTISYNGSNYYGSQIQPDKITIQSKVEEVFKILNITTTLEFSGRTDKGVHAFRQSISCLIPHYWNDLSKLKISLNKLLPNSIYIRKINFVDLSFHARFSAKKREYRYLITSKKLTPFNSDFITFYTIIDEKKINETIKHFIGVHDFEYFAKKGSDPISYVREIYDIKFYKYNDIYVLNFKANSYLRSQIRMMVDFIMKISEGKLTIDNLKMQLKKEKLVSWTLANSNGLYLSKIHY